MRTANRNIDYLKSFAELILCENKIEYNGDDLALIVEKLAGKPKVINDFFDKKSIAFGKWLLERNQRTLEHSMEELMIAFNEYQSSAKNEEQVDFVERPLFESNNTSNWCESCSATNCIC